MKKSDTQYIQDLIVADLTGVIDAGEKEYLDQLKATDPSIQHLWEEMEASFAAYQIINANNNSKEWLESAAITSMPRVNRSRKIRVVRYAAVAAALIIGVGTATYLIRSPRPGNIAHTDASGLSVAENNKNIRLTLANGKVVDLSGLSKDSVSAAGVHLIGTGKSLSYALSKESPETASTINTLAVPIGKDYHLVLADGSEIWMNSATVLHFPFQFSGNVREISIDGEAFLKVAKNERMPFQVRTPHGMVRVLGTEFNVNSYDSGIIKVALLNGAVQVQAGNRSVQLKPGKEAVYIQQRGIQVQDFDEDLVLSWTKGLFSFRTATLQEITRVLPRWFGVEVVMDRPELTNAHFTGVMNRNAPITVFLDNIKFAMNIDYYFDKAGTLHFK